MYPPAVQGRISLLSVILFKVIVKYIGAQGPEKIVTADILGQLDWQSTEEIYIYLSARPGLGAVACGDNDGNIWLYDLQANITSEDQTKTFKQRPTKVSTFTKLNLAEAGCFVNERFPPSFPVFIQ